MANFNDKLIRLFDIVAPVKITKQVAKFKPKLTPGIKTALRERNAAKNQVQRDRSIDSFNRFKLLWNKAK